MIRTTDNISDISGVPMKNTTILAFCLTILFLSMSCRPEPQIDDYAIEKVTRPLSNEDLGFAFNALGLTIERFDCMFPKRTVIRISSEQYVDGNPSGATSEGTLYIDKGLQRFYIFKKEHHDKTVEFSFKNRGTSLGCGQSLHEGYDSSTYALIDIDEITQDKQPIYVYAAGKGGIMGVSSPLVDIKALATQHDFMLVIYLSIENE